MPEQAAQWNEEAGEEHIMVDDMLLDGGAISSKGSDGDGSQAASGIPVYYAKKWPRGVVPVAFDSTIPLSYRNAFNSACAVWSQYAGVKCISRTTQADYLYVTDDASGCYTNLGAYSGPVPSASQRRVFNFSASWCWAQDKLLHEIGHVLGLMHEHQRPDRDTYVTLNLANVQSGFAYAYDKFTTMAEYSSYDYLSIMHYHSWAYSWDTATQNHPVMLKKSGALIYENKTLSYGDKNVMNRMYPKYL
jgi:hypothetical protein